jgi:hypothetical protein
VDSLERPAANVSEHVADRFDRQHAKPMAFRLATGVQ